MQQDKIKGRTGFLAALIFLVFLAGMGFGIASFERDWFPVSVLRKAGEDIWFMAFQEHRNFNVENVRYDRPIAALEPHKIMPGLLLVMRSDGGRPTKVEIIKRDGTLIHDWHIALDAVWPDPSVFPEDRRPQGSYGMYLHGIAMLPDGGFVANFEHLSTIRVDVCGRTVWQRNNLGHHSVHLSDQNELWVAGERAVLDGPTGYPNHFAPYRSWTIERLSLDGELLQTIEINDIFEANALEGWATLRAVGNVDIGVTDDSLHLNDVETFPHTLESEIFAPGDVMLSLREINAVLVIDPDTLKIKFKHIGPFVRQHDPDFLPGDVISVFDNYNLVPVDADGVRQSRIIEINARTGESKVVLRGDGAHGFFSNIMGEHQRLQNGNVMVVSTSQGRVFEFALDGALVWRYANRVSKTENARLYSVRVLPAFMDEAFFADKKAGC